MADKNTPKQSNTTARYVGGAAAAAAVVGVALYLSGPADPVDDARPVQGSTQLQSNPQDTTAPAQDTSAAPTEQSTKDETAKAAPATEAPAQAETSAAAPTDQQAGQTATPAPTDPETPPLPAPQLDVVRVSPDGSALVAGKSYVGSEVAVFVDDQELATTQVSGDGSFALFVDIAPTGLAQVVYLEARLGDQSRLSDDQIILTPRTQVAEIAPEAAQEPAAEPSTETSEQPAETAETTDADAVQTAQTEQPQNQSQQQEETSQTLAQAEPEVSNAPLTDGDTARPDSINAEPDEVTTATRETEEDSTAIASADTADAAEAETAQAETARVEPATDATATDETPAEPAAPSVIKSGADGLEALPVAPSVDADVALSLEAIGYSATGDVQLAGRGAAGNTVRIYLDNGVISDAEIGDGSTWAAQIAGIEPGIYTLRLDELDAAGGVVNRLETPFKREAPEVLNPPAPVVADTSEPEKAEPPVRAVTVQKGDTLWAISRERYGEGVLYVKVFDANRSDIRDPDLIYPGQVFALPD